MRRFAQGDLIEAPPFHFSAKSRYGVTSFVRELGDPEEDEELFELAAESRPRFGMITTETCDIVEEDTANPKQPFILVAPVYDFQNRVEPDRQSMILERRISYLYPIEAPGSHWRCADSPHLFWPTIESRRSRHYGRLRPGPALRGSKRGMDSEIPG